MYTRAACPRPGISFYYLTAECLTFSQCLPLDIHIADKSPLKLHRHHHLQVQKAWCNLKSYGREIPQAIEPTIPSHQPSRGKRRGRSPHAHSCSKFVEWSDGQKVISTLWGPSVRDCLVASRKLRTFVDRSYRSLWRWGWVSCHYDQQFVVLNNVDVLCLEHWI